MDYLQDIEKLITVLHKSDKFHLLCVSGPAGWAKTHTTRNVLGKLNVEYSLLGSYTTPLALFNHLSSHPDETLVLDDTAGFFQNSQAMSILNAATWSSVAANGERFVSWNSTSEKADVTSFTFCGKIIVLTNFIPRTPQACAFINRSLHYEIELNQAQIATNLLEAANSDHFEDPTIAFEVAEFLGGSLLSAEQSTSSAISLRTLELGIELRKADPHGWKELLRRSMPCLDMSTARQEITPKSRNSSVESILRELHISGLPPRQQFEKYHQLTGNSRRSFYYHRKALGLSGSS